MEIEHEPGMEIEEIKTKPTVAQKNKDNIPWVEKYRPSSLKDLISHKSILETINKFIEEKKLPNLLFYGPPGTGKTSTIVACAKQMYGSSYSTMCLELNASDERGIEVVRKTIKEFASTQNISFKGIKLVILDEADSMTVAAQFALRRIIEKYAKNTRFCMICNYVSKVIPALQSRCTRFKFRPIPIGEAKVRVQQICAEENLNVTDDGIECIFKLAEGDMRKVVNMLQSISISRGNKQGIITTQNIDSNFVYELTGNLHPDDIKIIIDTLMNADLQLGFATIQSIKQEKGIAIVGLLKELTLRLMDIDMPPTMKKFLVKRMAELEYRCSLTCNEKVMLGSLVGAFVEARSVKNLSSLQ